MKIVTVLGARPQFVKASVVSRALAKYDEIKEIIIHTGQHFDQNMSDIFFSELDLLSPDYHLGIHGLSHGAMSGRMMEQIEILLKEIKPDVVNVYGDTDSTLAAALAACKLHIPVAHIEAGLRSFNRMMPEEINRVVTDHVSEILFTPTDTADDNLHSEGISSDKIFQVGDVMYDASLYYGAKAHAKSTLLKELKLEAKGYYLATIHRPQNTDTKEALSLICNVLDEVAEKISVVLPVHPRTRAKMREFNIALRHVICIDPVGYLDMIALESQSALIITDSGGVQKEAYFHRVPCVTLRSETEWVELVRHRWNVVVPPSNDVDMVSIIHHQAETIGENVKLYGSGKASEKIAEHLVSRIRR
ncbi:MAG TPA: UDP-N-acetylglucosamine 2-epimerase (non-hydrolyzing) [Saprospiraceae bacterium]|nr:UDP-N-acetylglucosamine 2-epimerase (non-hydrolyzing) [Saprospiraceae bacterium]